MKCGECDHFVRGVKVRASYSGRCKHGYLTCISENSRACKRCFKPKCMTNADRIRAMSDEELATWLYHGQDRDIGSLNKAEISDWLQQPCGGADHE